MYWRAVGEIVNSEWSMVNREQNAQECDATKACDKITFTTSEENDCRDHLIIEH
jgi:hypothetical protein